MHNDPHAAASESNHEIRALASLLFFAAENCEDADFGRLRNDCITVFYIIEKKTVETERHLERIFNLKGASQ